MTMMQQISLSVETYLTVMLVSDFEPRLFDPLRVVMSVEKELDEGYILGINDHRHHERACPHAQRLAHAR